MREIFGTYPDQGEWMRRSLNIHIPPSYDRYTSENYQPSWPNYTNIPDYSIFLHTAFLPWDVQEKRFLIGSAWEAGSHCFLSISSSSIRAINFHLYTEHITPACPRLLSQPQGLDQKWVCSLNQSNKEIPMMGWSRDRLEFRAATSVLQGCHVQPQNYSHWDGKHRSQVLNTAL